MKFGDFLINLGDYFYYYQLANKLEDMRSVLDLGCGHSSPLRKIKKNFFSVGVDLFRPSLAKSQKEKIHDEYHQDNVRDIDRLFRKKSFDAVIALDLIEHLSKKEGLMLLKKMEDIARKKIILLTPNDFTNQAPLENNPHQIHQSGWTTRDFKKKGFRVYGLRGIKFIRGECATIKYRPWFFWGLIASLSQILVYYWPNLAYQLFAVKELKK